MIKRRDFNKFLALGGLAAAFPALPLRGLRAQGPLAETRLAENIHMLSGAGCNVVVAVGPDSAVVIDGGLREHAGDLLGEINRLAGGKPISTLFNTNWRPEHAGLNYLLAPSDTTVVAHENTRLWQGADFYVEWEDVHYRAMPREARAEQGFYQKGTLVLGGETIEYGYLAQAHTDGDIYVRFPRSDVLVVSDVLGVGAYPTMDYRTGGWIGGMQDATAALLELAGENTSVVAARGPVQSRADLQAQAEMLDKAYEAVADAFRNGRSLEDFKALEPAADWGERWGDPDLFLTQLYRGTWYHIPGRAVPGII